ncbi:MAG TPA: S8 family serine peptidase [Chthoniobacterales bacterium]|nr:S8 family serine peptidase [Chthoniobacterales bacterium]
MTKQKEPSRHPRRLPLHLKLLATTLFTAALALTGGGLLQAQDDASDNDTQSVDETPELWLVELPSAPASEGTSAATLASEKNAFRTNAKKAGLQFTEQRAFDTLWNGISVKIDRSQVAALARVPGVKSIYPNVQFTRAETTEDNSPDLASAIAMTGANIAQNTLGLSGAGVRVGIIDTGVDVDHPDLGGDGDSINGDSFPNSRIVVGYDFVGNAYNAASASTAVPVPDDNPDDCGGHGTHVAGIVGANGTVKGVAPGVTFGAYRVFGCEGSTNADIMIAAMERALQDGMNVVNMSIGSAYQWPQFPTAQASDRLVNKGVVVVASIGNSGATGLYSAGAPGVGKKVIGVASIDNAVVSSKRFNLTSDGTGIAYNQATAAPPAPTSGTFPMARTGTATSTADACNALVPGSLAGKVALIRRGTCGFHQKANNARNAGAVGVVLYNNAVGALNPSVAGSPAITIPVVGVSKADGELINSRIASAPTSTSMTWTADVMTAANPTGGLISAFSSYGLAPDLSFKPNIAAPGGSIRSTWPLELGSFNSISGTSMSSPHVAGAAALVLQAAPKTSSQVMGRILQNSADPAKWGGNPASGLLDNVHRQGAGMVDIDDAILATSSVEPASLALGESESGPSTRTLTLTNNGTNAVTYEVSHEPAQATGASTFVPTFFNAPATATHPTSVTVPAGGSSSIDVTIAPNTSLADKGLYGGYIKFTPQVTPQLGVDALRVPYSGLKGDYQAMQVLAPTVNGFPWLAKLAGTSFLNQANGATFTMQGTDIPYVVAHFDHQSRRVRMVVTDAVSGKSWHRALELEYLGRNSGAATFFSLPWDGVTVGGNKTYTVPNGQYVITLTVEKALGDAANPAHTESWTSPVITIARP